MIRGAIETRGATHIAGWAAEDTVPDRSLTVTVLLDRREIARTSAALLRHDLARAGLGNGRHGFWATIPRDLTEIEPARIEVRALDDFGRFRSLPWDSAVRRIHVDASVEDADARPVFILGSPRSGTSAVAAALRAATRYRGHDEGHLFTLLPGLLAAVERHYDQSAPALEAETSLAAVPMSEFEARFRALFVTLARERFGTEYWLDKTPSNSMIAAAPLLGAMWPNARFLFLKRRPIDNLSSRLRKFGGAGFEAHCRDWSDAMHFWAGVRDGLAGRAVEIDQLELARRPDYVGAEIGAALALDSAEVTALCDALKRQRPEQTGPSIDRTIGLEATGWSAEQKTIFRAICGPAMRLYGYDEVART